MNEALLKLTRSLYGLSLGVWAGAMVMLGITAVSAFRVLPTFEPSLGVAPFHEPDFEGRAASVLAGAVVNRSLQGLQVIGVVALVVALACVALQYTACRAALTRRGGSKANVARLTLLAALVVLVAFDFGLGVYLRDALAAMYDAGSSIEARAAARRRFDAMHGWGEIVNRATLLVVVAALLVSPFCFRPANTTAPAGRRATD